MKNFKYDCAEESIVDNGYPWNSNRQTMLWVPSRSRVLELGCATGYFGRYLKKEKECTVYGIEQDTASAEVARPFYRKIICKDLNDPDVFQLIDERFDVVLCLAVLEHLVQPGNVLRKLKKYVEPNGSIIISLPNIAHWSIRWSLLIGKFNYSDYGLLDATHLRFFTYQTARELLENENLEIKEVAFDFDSGFPIFNGIIRRLPGGWVFLKFIYEMFPGFFAYQLLFKTKIRSTEE